MAAQQRSRGEPGHSLSKGQVREAALPPEQPPAACQGLPPELSLPHSQDTKEVRQESGQGLLLLHTAQSGSSPVPEGCRGSR